MLAVGFLGGAPTAQASGAAEPPRAGELARETQRILRDPAYTRAAGVELRRGGGGGVGVGEPEAQRGTIFPKRRVVTLYGAPQLSATALGKRTPRGAARKVVKQARPYARLGDRRVVPGLDLIAVVATSSPGRDRLYRTRQPNKLIRTYLRRVRAIGGRLVLDIQPGRSSVGRELRALRKWIEEPDVDVAIDPEWNVGPKGVPGRSRGSIGAKELNRASRWLSRIAEEEGLPPKLMVVHQFRRSSIRRRARIKQRENISVTLNFDGIGRPKAKKAGYTDLAQEGLFEGFSLFYDLDKKLMRPRSVLRLRPAVDFLLYQ